MGELAERYSRICRDWIREEPPEVQHEIWLLHAAIESMEQKNESLTAINAEVEQENDRLQRDAEVVEQPLRFDDGAQHYREHIWKLESALVDIGKRNAELADIAEQAIDGWESLWSSDHNEDRPDELTTLRVRLLMSSSATDYVHVRDRDALLAAVSEIVKCDMRAIRTVPVSALEHGGGFTLIRLKSGEMTTDDLNRAAAVVVLEKRHDPNPELIERASTMLAEAYIAAQKETK